MEKNKFTEENIKEKIKEVLGDENEVKEFAKNKLKRLLEIMLNYVMEK